MQKIYCHEIFTPAKRIKKMNTTAIDALAVSIAETGLANPIHVVQTEDGYIVVAGMHRFKACIKLGWKQIDAFVLDADTPAEELLIIEIDENLCQGTLTACEFIESLYIRKQSYEKLHPEMKNGGDRGNQHTGGKVADSKIGICQNDENSEPLKCFTLQIAELTGVSKSKIYSGLSAYPILEPIWNLVKISTINDQFTQITSLAQAKDSRGQYEDEDYRLKIIKLIDDKNLPLIKKVKDAIYHLKGKSFDNAEDKNTLAFETRWSKAPTSYKHAVYENYHEQIIKDLIELGYLQG